MFSVNIVIKMLDDNNENKILRKSRADYCVLSIFQLLAFMIVISLKEALGDNIVISVR